MMKGFAASHRPHTPDYNQKHGCNGQGKRK